jgi:hypothetical protein
VIATQGLAQLPGAHAPDYMPAGFFNPAGGTLRHRGVTDMMAPVRVNVRSRALRPSDF